MRTGTAVFALVGAAAAAGACSSDGGDGGGSFGSGGTGNGTGAGAFAGSGAGPSTGGSGAGLGFGGVGGGGNAPGTGGGGGGAPVVIDDCPGAIDTATQMALEAGGGAPTRMLYPYNRTVFPRGLAAPVLQWEQMGGSTAGILRLTSQNFSARLCFSATPPGSPGAPPGGQFSIPQGVWDQATANSNGAGDPLFLELVTTGGNGVSAPLVNEWAVSPATLKGAVYYNTYNSPQAANNGAVMRVVPGGTAQVYLTEPGLAPLGPCVSCHSVSANGARMLAVRHQYGLIGLSPPWAAESRSYQVSATPNMQTGGLEASFAGLTPDGTRYMTNGAPLATFPGMSTTFPRAIGNVMATDGPRTSVLHDASTGAALPASGWDGVIQFALMPQFSADGTKIVFNHHEAGNGKVLAKMDFDPATNAFSNYEVIWDARGQVPNEWFPGWPFFTPDNQQVIFSVGNTNEYVSEIPNDLGIPTFHFQGDLYTVDVATKQWARLDRAGGRDGAAPYVPYPGRDEHVDFYPTVSPVAAGGYFWLFFTSRRNFGNTQVGPVAATENKNLWVSAITIGAPPGTDPSHPPFFLPGQELVSGNHRAFASLEPCRPDGQMCSTGIDCCCGGCIDGVCGCPQGCSNIDEACTTAADCCDPSAQCINGFCAVVVR